MKSNTLTLTVAVCIVLAVTQTAFLITPPGAIRLYNMALRPLVYTILAVVTLHFMGHDERPVRKSHDAMVVAIVSVALLGIVFLILAFLFGAGANALTVNPHVVVRNLWERGFVVILGEFIRYKLIKNTNPQNRGTVAVALAIALAYAQMHGIRMLIDTDVIVWALFFESIFRPLVISAVASYIAIESSFLPVVMISFIYTMAPYLMPITPDITPIAFSLIISGLAFVTAVIHGYATNEKKREAITREKRAARYEKRPLLEYGITAAIIIVVAAFFAGVFPVYPVVVLTGSMAGTFERGSIVFVERVLPGDAFTRVGEGYVIHFMSRGRVEYIHRVVDFVHNADGEREFITRGDASELTDPFPVPQDDVLGIARATLPFFGYPYIYLRAISGTFR